MSSLTGCLAKAGPALHPEDKAAILSATRALRKDGMSADDSAKKAVGDRLAEVQTLLDAAEPALLTSPTPDSLKDRAARIAAASNVDAAEQKRLADKATADAQRGEFALTGSDRPADVGAAAGQRDLLREEAKVYSVNENTRDLFGDIAPSPEPKMPARKPAARAEKAPTEAPSQLELGTPVTALRPDEKLPGIYYLSSQLVTVGNREIPVSKVTTWDEAAAALSALRNFSVEHFDVLITDKAGKPLAVVGSFKGAQSQASVYPGTMLQEALRIEGAAHAWGVHNHPSGLTTLSRPDERLNQTLARTFDPSTVTWHGVAAVGRRGTWNAAERDGELISGTLRTEAAAPTIVPIVERTIVGPGEASGNQSIDSPQRAKDLTLKIADGKAGILFLDAQNVPTAWVPVDPKWGSLRQDARFNALINAAGEAGAGAAIIANPDGVLASRMLDNYASALMLAEVRVLDVIGAKGNPMASAAETGRDPNRNEPVFSLADGAYPAQTAAYAKATPEQTAFAKALSDRLAMGPDGKPLYGRTALFDAVAPGSVDGQRGQELAAVRLASRGLWRHEVVFVKFRDGVRPLFNGAMWAEIPGVVFINVDSPKPLMAVMGHELLHQLRATNPGLYRDLQGRLNEILQDSAVYRQRYEAANKRNGNVPNPGQWVEELHADIVGDRFLEPEFWKLMAEGGDPSLFQRVLQAIARFIDGVIVKMGRRRGFGTEQFLTDLTEARAAVAEAMRGFAQSQGATRADGPNLSAKPVMQTGFDITPTMRARAESGVPLFSLADNVWNGIRGFNQTAARNAFLDATTSHASTGWFNAVNTQYAKAQKNPTTFGRVFNAVQDYIGDTSVFANAAGDLAPGILPKLEDFRGALPSFMGGNKKTNSADLKAAGAALWKGTLTDSKVYSAAELTALGLTADQQVLYRQARAAIDQSLDDMVKTEVVRLAGLEGTPLARQAMAEPTAGRAAEVIKAASQDETLHALLDDKVAQIQKLKAEGYAPLMRFGRHTLHVTDAEGNTQYFGMYESNREANAATRELKRDPALEGMTFTQGLMSEESFKLYQGVPIDALELFARTTGNEANPVYQDFLKLTKSNRSVMKRLIHRQGIAGFNEDTARVLAAFVTSNARYASGNLHLGQAKAAADAIPKEQGDLKDDAVKLVEYVQNPQEEASAIRGLLFVNFIGGSVASAAVNLTQPFTMSLPYLSQFGGAVKAAGHLLAATKTAAGGRLDPQIAAAMAIAEANGIVSPQEIHHLQAEAMGGIRSPMLKKAAFIWGSMFSLAEQFNRRVTFIAAYNAALQQHIDNPQAFAEKAVIETQGLYNKGNKPNLARGAIGATVMTFKQFSIHYLEFMGRMWDSGPEGKKAVGVAIAVMLLTAGAGGLPFADDLDNLIDTLAQAFGYDFSSKRAKRKFIAETLGLGEGAAQFATRGVSGISGMPIDVSLRMGMGNLLPMTGILLRSNTDRSRDVLELGGAAGSLGKSFLDAGQLALQGDFAKAGLTMAPLAVQNMAKAVKMWNTGEYRNAKGQKVIDTSPLDAIAKGIGFQPGDVAAESQKMGETKRRIDLAKNVSQDIASKWAQALNDGDTEAISAARAELRQWNENNPESRLHISMQSIIHRVREMRMDRSQRAIKLAPIGMRQEVREALQ